MSEGEGVGWTHYPMFYVLGDSWHYYKGDIMRSMVAGRFSRGPLAYCLLQKPEKALVGNASPNNRPCGQILKIIR